ncbi:MAG TPA: CDP-alcohol phosphatidyltransferase family protein [Candidatus Eisenbacteria bacterium]|nr:CDP-alcohol phosphatidyltransferase family protein [Candidatus Eisenbacteria bacterium]
MTGSLVTPAARQRVRKLATPVAVALGRLGLSPDALTVLGFVGTAVAAVAAANQLWVAAGVLALGFGVFDLFDGALARVTGRASNLGAFMDSVFDRAGEALLYLGIVAGLGSAGWVDAPLFAAAAMAAAFMVSYTRAKSEGLGFTSGTGMAAVGIMPREVRLVILAVGLVAGGIIGTTIETSCATCAGGAALPMGILVIQYALGLIALGGTITVIQRVLHVRAQAAANKSANQPRSNA